MASLYTYFVCNLLFQHTLAVNDHSCIPPDISRIPGMVVTARGTLLAYWELRHGGDLECYALALRRSEDGGATWSPTRQLVTVYGDDRLNNPVMVARRDGTVCFLWSPDYARVLCAVSGDDGLTFHSQTEITPALAAVRARDGYDWDVCALGPGHGIELRDGALLVPFWLANSGEGKHRPSAAGVLRSEDGGQSWQAGRLITGRDGHFKNPSEASLAELPGGGILMNLRHEGDTHCRAMALSRDGGYSFGEPALRPDLPDPICLGSMTIHPTKNLLAFCNCGSQTGRENLTLRFSTDGGATWPAAHKIADLGCYSDLAFSPDGKRIYVFYEQGKYESLVFESYALSS